MPTASTERHEPFAAMDLFRAKLRGRVSLPLVGIGVQLADPISSDAMGTVVDFIWYDQHPTPAAFSPFMAVVLDAMTTPDLCDTPANLHCHIITFQEHTPMSIEMLKWHILAAHGRGIPAIVRVPGPNNHVGRSAGLWGADIKHALDGGADGVVVPMVRSADEVRAIVADCRYPTGGGRPPPFDHPGTDTRRGFGPVTPMVYGHAELYSYLARADRNVFVAVMIETVEALKDIDAICAVKGLDCVVIGAMDLSGSLGLPYLGGSPKVQDAIDTIIAAARAHGVYAMFSTRNAEMASKLTAKGVDIVHFGSDVTAAVDYQRGVVSQLKHGGSSRL